MPQIQCLKCGASLRVPDTAIGKQVRCPACEHVFVCQAEPDAFGSAMPSEPSPPEPASSADSAPPSSSPTNQGGGLFDDLPANDSSYGNGGDDSNPFGAPPASGTTDWMSSPAQTGQSNPHQPNPYAAPVAPAAHYPSVSAYESDRSAFYMINGIFFALWGGLLLLSNGFQILAAIMGMQPAGNQNAAGELGSGVFGIGLAGIFIAGGICLALKRNLGLSRTAAILAAIPCCGVCVFPFGIWACVLLFDDRARRDFNE